MANLDRHTCLKMFRLLPGYRQLDRYLRRRYTGYERPEFALRGSYYSPLPDYQEVEARADDLFRTEVEIGPSIRLRTDEQAALLREISRFYPEFDWSESRKSGRRFLPRQ